jgi:hypothetical protein
MLPERIDLGRLGQFCVGHCFYTKSNPCRGVGEKLMNFVVPDFQRPPVWSKRQQVSFMESLILGLPVGTYCYSSAIDNPKVDGWLIDGQQRIRALAAFVEGDIEVFGCRWPSLERHEQRRIENQPFPAYVLLECSEKELLTRYVRLNYSGTPHTEADKRRAKRKLKTVS